MKRIILSTLIIAALASCKKLNDVLPEQDYKDDNTSVNIPATPEEKTLLTSIKVTPVFENTSNQKVLVSTTGNQLNLTYNEEVQLLIDKERYDNAWYVIFKEDFSNTLLDGVDYKMVMQWGETVLNWKPYNLHQIDAQRTDTTIAGVKVLNVKFKRTFNFFKDYSSEAEATAKASAIVGKKEVLKFLTRYEPDSDTTRHYVSSVNLQYVAK